MSSPNLYPNAVQPIRIDVHAHLLPFDRNGTVIGSSGAEWSASGFLTIDGATLENGRLYGASHLLDWMMQHGVAEAWVSIPPTAYRLQLQEEETAIWCEVVNSALQRLETEHRGKVGALLHIPVQYPSLAAKIVRAAAANGACKFAMANSDPQGRLLLSDDAFTLLWEALEACGAFLFLHPARPCDTRFTKFSLMNLLGGPTETALAAAHLAMSGTLEKYSRITFCLAHGGGTLPAVVGRIQLGQDNDRPGAYLGGQKIRDAVRRFCVDCITHDSGALEQAARTFGEDRILFGSDWPFPMGLLDPAEALAQCPEPLRLRILHKNAEALLSSRSV